MKKVVKVISLVLLMVAVSTSTVAALPSSVTRPYGSTTVTLSLTVNICNSSSVSCYKNGSSGVIQLESFITKYADMLKPEIVKTNYQYGGTGIGLVSKHFDVPGGYQVIQANATASVSNLAFHESVEWKINAINN